MNLGIADYGMTAWDGALFDIEDRLLGLKKIGYEGTERLIASSASDAVHRAGLYRRLGMDFALCLAPNVQDTIEWTAAFRKRYVWVDVSSNDFETFCRQVNRQTEVCRRWGLRVGLHNHLGSLVESQQELERFLKMCPGCGLIFDTAHLAAAGGDCLEIVRKYPDRIVSVHLKDWLVTSPETGLDQWQKRGRFCELGAGNIGLDNRAILKALAATGYDGWILVEQDTHLQDPLIDLTISRQYIRDSGF